MTSNLAEEEIASHVLQLREEAKEYDKAKKKNMFVSCNPTDRVKIVPTRKIFSRILKIGDCRLPEMQNRFRFDVL